MLIGLCGYKGSGKDTVADHLVANYDFKKLAFADKMKDSICALLNITRDELEELKGDNYCVGLYFDHEDAGDVGVFNDRTFRQFLQRYGTESHRDIFGEDFWVAQLFAEFGKTLQEQAYRLGKGNYVISDCRFDNEVLAIQQRSGVIVLVNRGINSEDPHRSEKLSSFGRRVIYELHNLESIEELHTNVDDMMEFLTRHSRA